MLSQHMLIFLFLMLLEHLVNSALASKNQFTDFDKDGVRLERMRRDTCKDGDCKNGGVCWPGPVTSATPPCLCPEQYTGSYCTNRVNYCATTAPNCQNGATCTSTDASPWFSCSCAPGFNGTNCEINIDDCASRPCINGQCTDLVTSYNCSCYSGWEGSNCNLNHNNCFAGACFNGGRCLDGNGTYTCECPDTGFSGARCEIICDFCTPSSCKNGGRCIDGVRSYTCDCSGTDFNGPNCQSRIDDCSPNPCQNNASCTDGLRDFSCSCFSGYSGKTCSDETVDCVPDKCRFNGSCLERSERALYGNSSLPAPFNGTFSYARAAGFVCLCPRGTYGDTCEINPNDCLIPGTNQSVCIHASSCTDGLASFTCHCLPGYEGPTCSVDINECELFGQPCQNGAVCKDLVADYACTNCPVGFGGKNCSVPILEYSFGVGGRVSSATFSYLPNNSSLPGGNSWTIELRLVTLSRGAFLMLLGDPSDSATTPRLLVTIDALGRIFAQLLHSNGFQIAALTSSDSVATGSFVSVKITVSISGRELSLAVSSAVLSASLSSASPLLQLSGQLIIGGFSGAPAAPAPSLITVDVKSRSKRSLPALPSSIVSSFLANVTAFRGILSATRLNGDMPLILASGSSSVIDSLPGAVVASDSSEVRVGVVSEKVCEVLSPCQHGATCVDIFYYYYSCQCHPGYSVVNCSIDYPDCSANPCKSGEVCLERSDQANYNLRFLPSPFNESFSYQKAPGFVCFDFYCSSPKVSAAFNDLKSSAGWYTALVLSGFVFATGLWVGVVCLLIRIGYLSRGKCDSHTAQFDMPSGPATPAANMGADFTEEYTCANEELCINSQASRQNDLTAPAASKSDGLDLVYKTLKPMQT